MVSVGKWLGVAVGMSAMLAFATHQKKETVRVQFHNKTGHVLENVRIGDRLLGTITTSTGYLAFDRIGFDGSAPDIPLTGEIGGEFIPNHSAHYFCGTEKYQVEDGRYDIDIVLVEELGRSTLLLNRPDVSVHPKRIIDPFW